MIDKKKILIIIGHYCPGYKDGGSVRTIKNLTDYLGDDYQFRILTLDRDYGDKKPYDDIIINDWNEVGKSKVYYVAPHGFKFRLIKRLAEQSDIVYVCGCFNDYAINTLLLKRLGLIKKPVVVAAMGLFSPMEFRLKYKKKKLFTTVFNFLGMFKKIYWSATSPLEITDIKQQIKAKDEQFFIATDMPCVVDKKYFSKKKTEGSLNVVWISRITPKKNLIGAVKILQKVKSRINFTIYGPIYSNEYWNDCQKELDKLPQNITWSYKGNIKPENVVNTLKKHHVFLFPTLGENYGHVIHECLSAGCPCILSDQTFWQDLEKQKAGYCFKLKDKSNFVKALESYAQMTQEEFQKTVEASLSYAIKFSEVKLKDTGYKKIFDNIC